MAAETLWKSAIALAYCANHPSPPPPWGVVLEVFFFVLVIEPAHGFPPVLMTTPPW